MKITADMQWPPSNILSYKMAEHSAWYSGNELLLSNYYAEMLSQNFLDVPYFAHQDKFWGRQIRNGCECAVHVPLAGDIAETSANFLFSEAPSVKIVEANVMKASQSYKDAQTELETLLIKTEFHRKILEGAESCAAMGGIYFKIAWDMELSMYPIPMIVQPDRAIPEFSFGILKSVTFWKTLESDDAKVVLRLLETYERGLIKYDLYKGTCDKLGSKVELDYHPETAEMEDVIYTGIDDILAVYIPNMLPNKLDRNSCLGRSDYLGQEGLMNNLDELFSTWQKEILLAQGRILIPESYLEKINGKDSFNVDRSLYVKLDMDPTIEGSKITATQFEIRADQFEKTALNLLERIITSAGYSPQSFGLNISGRAESGTALSMRERKSFATKNKKQAYWQPAISKLVELMILVYNEMLMGSIEENITLNVAFSDGITNDLGELSASVKLLSDAMAASVETKVKLIHPDWNEEQVAEEVQKIKDENALNPVVDPDTTGGEEDGTES